MDTNNLLGEASARSRVEYDVTFREGRVARCLNADLCFTVADLNQTYRDQKELFHQFQVLTQDYGGFEFKRTVDPAIDIFGAAEYYEASVLRKAIDLKAKDLIRFLKAWNEIPNRIELLPF